MYKRTRSRATQAPTDVWINALRHALRTAGGFVLGQANMPVAFRLTQQRYVNNGHLLDCITVNGSETFTINWNTDDQEYFYQDPCNVVYPLVRPITIHDVKSIQAMMKQELPFLPSVISRLICSYIAPTRPDSQYDYQLISQTYRCALDSSVSIGQRSQVDNTSMWFDSDILVRESNTLKRKKR